MITREEAIKHITTWMYATTDLPPVQVAKAFDMAIAALRPVSREQVGQVWGGCEWCDEEWGTCNPITNRFTMPPRGGIRFCPMCGKPLTDEAVEILMKRLEKMHETM